MAIEPLLVEPGHVAFVLVDERALIQVRAGAMTHAILDRCETEIFPRVLAAQRPFGSLLVVNGDAHLQAADVRARQKEAIGRMLDVSGTWAVSVVEGESIHASSVRTVSRLLVMGKPRLVHRADVPAAAAWLSAQIGVQPRLLEAAVAEARASIRSPA
jgi:hypothetical protein